MNIVKRAIAVSLLASLSISANAEVTREDFKEAGTYQLDGNTQIIVENNQFVLIGEKADEELTQSEGIPYVGIDALLYQIDARSEEGRITDNLMYDFYEVGYVTLDDWNDLDSDALLEDMKIGTIEDNKSRTNGVELIILGWAQEPILSKEDNAIYWASEVLVTDKASGEKRKIINAKVLKLGRKGYSAITWIGTHESFSNARDTLKPFIDNYSFVEGHKYENFIPDVDTVATFGAGALLYKLVTGKAAAKTAVVGGSIILLLLKKFWFVLLAPFAFVGKLFKKKGDKE